MKSIFDSIVERPDGDEGSVMAARRVGGSRWQRAQTYERGYWEERAQAIGLGERDLRWYAWRADQLLGLLGRSAEDAVVDEESLLLEVGAGPVGMLGHLPGRIRVSVDPLQRFYATVPEFSDFRSASAAYVGGLGEALPLKDALFDLVILDNCIDHVQDPQLVMGETMRVLRTGGVLFITVNCRAVPGAAVHRILSKLEIDRGHPHTFTATGFRRFVEEFPVRIRRVERDSYWKAFYQDIRGKVRSKLKALLGTSEFVTTIVATREAERGEEVAP